MPILVHHGYEGALLYLNKTKEGGFLEGFLICKRGGEGTKMSHLLFVDNTLILCDVSKEHMEHLCW